MIINVQLYTFSGHILSSNMAWLPGFIQGCNFFFFFKNSIQRYRSKKLRLLQEAWECQTMESKLDQIRCVDGRGVWNREMDRQDTVGQAASLVRVC